MQPEMAQPSRNCDTWASRSTFFSAWRAALYIREKSWKLMPKQLMPLAFSFSMIISKWGVCTFHPRSVSSVQPWKICLQVKWTSSTWLAAREAGKTETQVARISVFLTIPFCKNQHLFLVGLLPVQHEMLIPTPQVHSSFFPLCFFFFNDSSWSKRSMSIIDTTFANGWEGIFFAKEHWVQLCGGLSLRLFLHYPSGKCLQQWSAKGQERACGYLPCLSCAVYKEIRTWLHVKCPW